jgi:Flp pilus assembly pilin Flp
MNDTKRFFDRTKRSQGQTAVEYAMILAAVALLTAASFNATGGNVVNGPVNATVAMLSGTSNAPSVGGSGGGGGDGGDGHHHGGDGKGD